MADVTINDLGDLVPQGSLYVPISNDTTTGRATISQITTLFSGVPTSVIGVWSGSTSNIPAGWYLCNGLNGTPDLRDRFVVGAGNAYAVGSTGGSKDAILVSHNHSTSSSVSDPGHSHTVVALAGSGSKGCTVAAGNRTTVGDTTGIAYTGISVSTSVAAAGSSGTSANLPPYYALCYIMKG